MLEGREYGTLAEVADAELINRSYVSRVLRLTLFAPDIVERILDGRPTARLALFLKPFPVEWQAQHERSVCSGSPPAHLISDAQPLKPSAGRSRRAGPPA